MCLVSGLGFCVPLVLSLVLHILCVDLGFVVLYILFLEFCVLYVLCVVLGFVGLCVS